MLKNSILSLVALLLIAAVLLPVATAQAANSDHRVRARMSGDSLMSGQARFRERTKDNTIEQRFKVQIEDGEPGAMLEIHLNGMALGVMVLDDFGFGELQFRTATFIDDPGDGTPIPPAFPTIQAGDLISVGSIMGVFN